MNSIERTEARRMRSLSAKKSSGEFFEQFNIRFHLPKKDKRVVCERFKNTPDDMRTEYMQQSKMQHDVEKNATYREHIDD